MDELLKALRVFVTRDLLYVIGGASVCLSGLYATDLLSIARDERAPFVVLAAGISYGVGFAVQEMLSLTPFLQTAPVIVPGRLGRFLYKRLCLTNWQTVSREELRDGMREFKDNRNDRAWDQLQRIITLKHVGAALGSNWLVVSAVLFAKWKWVDHRTVDLILADSTLVCAVCLLLIAKAKNAEQVQYVAHRYER